jgi:plasmid stability protein
MADILIPDVDDATRELLQRRAERHGRSIEADLREILEKLAREEAEALDDTVPFGQWLFAISRPGVDLDPVLELFRAVPVPGLALAGARNDS